jgi:hypothetical protein
VADVLAKTIFLRGQSCAAAVLELWPSTSAVLVDGAGRMANSLKQTLPDARVYAFGNVLMTTFRHWIGEASVPRRNPDHPHWRGIQRS